MTMKKFFLSSLIALAGLTASAQSEMSAEELAFRNGMEQFIREEGFTPTIDDDDNSVNFKKEGISYWITVTDSDPYYIRFHRGGISFDASDRTMMLEACNYANLNKRCGKANIASSGTVTSFTVEYYCSSVEQFKKSFYDYLSCLTSLRNAARDYIDEHSK